MRTTNLHEDAKWGTQWGWTSSQRLLSTLALATLPACSDGAAWSAYALTSAGVVLTASTLHRLWRWDAELSVAWEDVASSDHAARSAARIPHPLRAQGVLAGPSPDHNGQRGVSIVDGSMSDIERKAKRLRKKKVTR